MAYVGGNGLFLSPPSNRVHTFQVDAILKYTSIYIYIYVYIGCIMFALEWLCNAALMFSFSAHFAIGIKQITMLNQKPYLTLPYLTETLRKRLMYISGCIKQFGTDTHWNVSNYTYTHTQTHTYIKINKYNRGIRKLWQCVCISIDWVHMKSHQLSSTVIGAVLYFFDSHPCSLRKISKYLNSSSTKYFVSRRSGQRSIST